MSRPTANPPMWALNAGQEVSGWDGKRARFERTNKLSTPAKER